MTAPIVTPTNGSTPIVERFRQAYLQQAARPSPWAKARPWLIGILAGLLIGGAVIGYASYQVMPPVASHVQNVFVTINGRPAVILSGDVVYDTAPLSSTPVGQP